MFSFRVRVYLGPQQVGEQHDHHSVKSFCHLDPLCAFNPVKESLEDKIHSNFTL